MSEDQDQSWYKAIEAEYIPNPLKESIEGTPPEIEEILTMVNHEELLFLVRSLSKSTPPETITALCKIIQQERERRREEEAEISKRRLAVNRRLYGTPFEAPGGFRPSPSDLGEQVNPFDPDPPDWSAGPERHIPKS